MPKVSVIIPTYNVEKYIAETLDSVLNQTYQDFEVIVVDDGSKDKTASIVREYYKKYPETVRLIQKKNGGPASARNVGINSAKGEYIAFNDADDLWLSEKIEKQVAYFERQPESVGLVYTDAKKFDCEGTWILPENRRKKRVDGWVYQDLLIRNVIPNQSVMVRKACFDKVGLFDESLEIIEDYDMWLRIALKYELSFLDEILSLYREQSQGRSKAIEKTLKRSIGVYNKHLKMASGNSDIENIVYYVLSERLYELGYFYLREGRMSEARKTFTDSLTIRFRIKTYLTHWSTYFPHRLLNMANRCIKSIIKPPMIKKSRQEFKDIKRSI